MSEEKSVQPASHDNKGIGDKAASVAHLASLKKRSTGASVGIDGVGQILNQKKDSRTANVGKQGNFAPNSKVTKPTIEKAGYTNQVRMRRFRSHVENVPALSEQGVPDHSGSEEENQKLKRELTEMNDRMKSMENQLANQLAKIIEATSVQVECPLSPANLDGQD